MYQQTKTCILAAIVLCIVNLSMAQGTLQATLLPDPTDGSLLWASVIVNTPATNSPGPYYPVAFEVIVNSNAPIFSVGRIAGGSTAWAFDLDAPTTVNGSTLYSGTTDMGAFQIDDMLANRTGFELYSYPTDGGYYLIDGVLIAVPEPQSELFLFAGFVTLLIPKMKREVCRPLKGNK